MAFDATTTIRIITLRDGVKASQARVAEMEEDWNQAKGAVKDREETLSKSLDELPEEKDAHADPALLERVAGIAMDLRRAKATFTNLDRQRRSELDLTKKMTQDLFDLVDRACDGGLADGFKPDPRAWEAVELRDLMGEMYSAAWLKVGMRTVKEAMDQHEGQAVKQAMLAGEITPEQLDHLRDCLADFCARRGIATDIKGGDIRLPAIEKPKQTDDDDDADSQGAAPDADPTAEVWLGDELAEAGFDHAWLTVPWTASVGPAAINNIDEDDVQEALDQLASWGLGTPDRLIRKLRHVFETSADAPAILTSLPDLHSEVWGHLGSIIAERLRLSGGERMWNALLRIFARNQDAVETLFGVAELHIMMGWPEDRRVPFTPAAEPEASPTEKPKTPAKKKAAKKPAKSR
ncbi:MAG: hypothetical protein ACK48N_07395 [Planctomyces sp.]